MTTQGFLETVSRAQFQEMLRSFAATATETVAFDRARGRVLAAELTAPEDLPTGRRSSMDGYALGAADSFGAGESSPAYLDCVRTLEVNEFPDFTLTAGQCAWIPTGGFLPAGADSVVMVEYTQEIGAGTIEVRQSVAPGENVMERGEDAAAGQPMLAAGTRLRTQEVGLLAALGLTEVRVHRRPRVAIVSTGDELVPVAAIPAPGRIRDVNSHTVACLAEEAGGQPFSCGIVGDDLAQLVQTLKEALAHSDVVFLSGGSSKGTRDHTLAALEQIPGTEILAHGVRISPGKPTILARAGDKAVIGLPGQVGSAQVVMAVLGQPFLRHLAGDRQAFSERLRPLRRARLARNLESRPGREDFVRVRLEPADGRPAPGATGSRQVGAAAHPAAKRRLAGDPGRGGGFSRGGRSGCLDTLKSISRHAPSVAQRRRGHRRENPLRLFLPLCVLCESVDKKAFSFESESDRAMAKRNIYLKTISPAEAIERAKAVLDRDRLLGTEIVDVSEAAGRVTAAPVYARYSAPAFHAAAMDGIAVKAERTFAAREGWPLRLEPETDYLPVNTGEPLPAGMDAVIKIEETVETAGGAIFIEAPAFPWAHVRRVGQDIVASELMLPQNHSLSPYDIGALLSAGVWEVEVRRRVQLFFIPTGDEVLDFTRRPTPGLGQVIESNSQVFCALARSWGALPQRVPPVPDDRPALLAAVRAALASEAQVVVVGAGSSAGEKDLTAAIFAELGEVLVHGLAVSPGKPTLLGVAEGKLLVGAPGYPGSAIVCFEEVLAPLVAWLGHTAPPVREKLPVRLTRKTPSRLGAEEVVRLAVGRIDGEAMAVPLGRGPGMITNLTRAQALLRVPAASEGVEQDATVEAELLTPSSLLECGAGACRQPRQPPRPDRQRADGSARAAAPGLQQRRQPRRADRPAQRFGHARRQPSARSGHGRLQLPVSEKVPPRRRRAGGQPGHSPPGTHRRPRQPQGAAWDRRSGPRRRLLHQPAARRRHPHPARLRAAAGRPRPGADRRLRARGIHPHGGGGQYPERRRRYRPRHRFRRPRPRPRLRPPRPRALRSGHPPPLCRGSAHAGPALGITTRGVQNRHSGAWRLRNAPDRTDNGARHGAG